MERMHHESPARITGRVALNWALKSEQDFSVKIKSTQRPLEREHNKG